MSISRIWDSMTKISPAKGIAVSMILKDAVGCYMYTTTARANKAYTPEKRSDVANYDLANGIINISLQIAAIIPIEKAMTWFSREKLAPLFFKNCVQRLAKGDAGINKFVKGSTALLSTIFCQYFIKRFVSPYFSMPTAEKFQQWGLMKPKLYPGETFGQKSVSDRFMYYMTSLISPKSNKSNDLSVVFKGNEQK